MSVEEKLNTILEKLEKLNVLEEKLNSLDSKFGREITSLKTEVSNLKKSFTAHENNYRRNNLVLFNLPDNPNEKIYDLEKDVESFLKDILKSQVDLNSLDLVKRLGPNTVKKRPVLIRFLALRGKMEVLKLAKNLKGTGLILSEDFPPHVREIRKKLYPYWKAAKEEKKKVYMKYDKLFIDDKLWELKELQAGLEARPALFSEDSAGENSTGTDQPSDGTLRRWLNEGKLIKKRSSSKKRKVESSPPQKPPFRRQHSSKESLGTEEEPRK